jgi:tRNA pseudouridine55 synthase
VSSSRRTAQTGILLVDKPAGITSHDVVYAVRRAFGQREVGHAGTLDPAATGLLVVALGDATRLLRFVEAADKAYEGTVFLGRATTTWDAEGETTAEAPLPPELSSATLAAAAATLVGTIEQAVPAFSAVKVDGERLYAKARRGEVVEAPRRTVHVASLTLGRVDLPRLEVSTTVSKGTYVRALAVDLGAALGLPAHLCGLRRTRIGRYDVADAHRLEALRGTPEELLSAESAVAHLPAIRLDTAAVRDVSHGRALSRYVVRAGAEQPFAAGQALRLVGPGGEVVAIAEARIAHDQDPPPEGPAMLAYACVLARPPATSR